jgi:hypothetical protein
MVEIQFANQIRRHLHERKIQEGRSITNHQRRIAREKIAGSLRGWREESPSRFIFVTIATMIRIKTSE